MCLHIWMNSTRIIYQVKWAAGSTQQNIYELYLAAIYYILLNCICWCKEFSQQWVKNICFAQFGKSLLFYSCKLIISWTFYNGHLNYFFFIQVPSGKGTLTHFFNLHVLVPTAHILGAKDYHVQQGTVISLVCIIENVSAFPFTCFIHYVYKTNRKPGP